MSVKKNKIALMDDLGTKITYQLLEKEIQILSNMINQRSLVFILCQNSIGSIIGYISFVHYQIVPLLLDSSINKAALHSLIQEYGPSYLWVPETYKPTEEYDNLIYSKYQYKLLKRNGTATSHLNPDLALLLTTSGSVGSSKLVRISYENLSDNANAIASYLDITCNDKSITTMPMNYTFGLSIINSYLISGATILVTKKSVFHQEFWDFFRREKATSISGVPAFYELLDKIGFVHMNIPGLKTMTQAGGKLPDNLQIKFGQYCTEKQIKFYIMYGQTEATARMAYLPYQRCLDKIGCIGIPIPGGKIEIVDDNGKTINEINKVGELVYYGKNVMMGYAANIHDLEQGDELKGKLFTGDLAQKDAEGFYYIVGRKKRIVKIQGIRFSLDEIEKFINNHYGKSICACLEKYDTLYIFIINNDVIKIKEILIKQIRIKEEQMIIKSIKAFPQTQSGKINYAKLNEYILTEGD